MIACLNQCCIQQVCQEFGDRLHPTRPTIQYHLEYTQVLHPTRPTIQYHLEYTQVLHPTRPSIQYHLEYTQVLYPTRSTIQYHLEYTQVLYLTRPSFAGILSYPVSMISGGVLAPILPFNDIRNTHGCPLGLYFIKVLLKFQTAYLFERGHDSNKNLVTEQNRIKTFLFYSLYCILKIYILQRLRLNLTFKVSCENNILDYKFLLKLIENSSNSRILKRICSVVKRFNLAIS